jgi:hypothetical protein
MNRNTRTRHIAESPVGGDVDRRSFLKLTGAGLVAALPISAAPWAGPAAAQSTQSIKREAYVMKTRKLASLEVSEIESRLWMTVGERRFAITLTDNAAARAFAAQLPLTLDMSELNGNEKHADLPKPLPANASRPGTIRNGDLMLYGGDTLVIFYLTSQSSYSYTRLGRVDEPSDLAQALEPRGVRVLFSKD